MNRRHDTIQIGEVGLIDWLLSNAIHRSRPRATVPAMGGKYRVLPSRLRIAVGIAVALYAVFAAILMSRGGILGGGNAAPIVVGTWVLFGYAAFSVLPNLASKSRKERTVQIPVSIALTIGIGFVAASSVVQPLTARSA